MAFQPGANVYTQGFGSRPENVEVPHLDLRSPATTDLLYPVGKRWVNTVLNEEWVLTSFSSLLGVTSANWQLLLTSGGPSAGIQTINDTPPDGSGNFDVLGTANQINVVDGANSVTLSFPDPIFTPGTLNVTNALNVTNSVNIGGSTATQALNVQGPAIFTSTIASGFGVTFSGTVTMTGTKNFSGPNNLIGPVQCSNIFRFSHAFVNGPTFNSTGVETFFNCNTASAITINLANNYDYGTFLVIADTNGLASGNNITINAGAGFNFQSLAGTSSSITINQNFGSVTIMTTTSNLMIIASQGLA